MSVVRRVQIDAEVESVGQFDRTETWVGRLQVTREDDGRVRIGKPTQAGFQAIVFDLDDLREAVS